MSLVTSYRAEAAGPLRLEQARLREVIATATKELDDITAFLELLDVGDAPAPDLSVAAHFRSNGSHRRTPKGYLPHGVGPARILKYVSELKRPTTIGRIAAATRVHPSTVARVLRENPTQYEVTGDAPHKQVMLRKGALPISLGMRSSPEAHRAAMKRRASADVARDWELIGKFLKSRGAELQFSYGEIGKAIGINRTAVRRACENHKEALFTSIRPSAPGRVGPPGKVVSINPKGPLGALDVTNS